LEIAGKCLLLESAVHFTTVPYSDERRIKYAYENYFNGNFHIFPFIRSKTTRCKWMTMTNPNVNANVM